MVFICGVIGFMVRYRLMSFYVNYSARAMQLVSPLREKNNFAPLKQLLTVIPVILKVREMTKIMVIYHSMTGNTEKMAEAIAEGAENVDGVEVILSRARDVAVDDLPNADGYAFGAPNTFGGMAGELRALFDNAWRVKDKMSGKPVVSFSSENQDTSSALEDIERFFNYYKLEKAAEGVIAVKTPSDGVLEDCKSLGKTLAGKCG